MKSFLQITNSHIKTEIPTNFVWNVLNECEQVCDHYDAIEVREFLNFFYPGIVVARRHFNQALFSILKTDLQEQLTYHFDGVSSHKMAERLFGQSITVHSIRNCKGTRGWEWKAWTDFYPPEKAKIHTDIAWDFANKTDLRKYSTWVIKGNVRQVFRGIEIGNDLLQIVQRLGEYCDSQVDNILTRYARQAAIKLTDGRISVPIKTF